MGITLCLNVQKRRLAPKTTATKKRDISKGLSHVEGQYMFSNVLANIFFYNVNVNYLCKTWIFITL